jgi:hypothetical protein
MSEGKSGGKNEERLTAAGCVLTTLSLALTIGVAIPIVMWRDPAGTPLPRLVAIYTPLLIGAAFQGIGTGILWLFGMKVLVKPDKDNLDWPEL